MAPVRKFNIPLKVPFRLVSFSLLDRPGTHSYYNLSVCLSINFFRCGLFFVLSCTYAAYAAYAACATRIRIRVCVTHARSASALSVPRMSICGGLLSSAFWGGVTWFYSAFMAGWARYGTLLTCVARTFQRCFHLKSLIST